MTLVYGSPWAPTARAMGGCRNGMALTSEAFGSGPMSSSLVGMPVATIEMTPLESVASGKPAARARRPNPWLV